MDFGGAGAPLIFFGPLRGAVGEPGAHQAHTRRTPGAHQEISPKQGFGEEIPYRGGTIARVPWAAAGARAVDPGRPGTSGPWRQGSSGPWRPGTSGPWAAGNPPPRWSSHGSSPPAGHLTDMPWGAPWSSHGFALGGPLVISRIPPPGSPASGRDSGRAREDSRGSFWMEWLRIEF